MKKRNSITECTKNETHKLTCFNVGQYIPFCRILFLLEELSDERQSDQERRDCDVRRGRLRVRHFLVVAFVTVAKTQLDVQQLLKQEHLHIIRAR